MSAIGARRLLVRVRHPQTTVRWRLTLLYGGLFLVCGAALLAVTYAFVEHASVSPGAVLTAVPPSANFQLRGATTNHHFPAGSKAQITLPPGTASFLRSSGGRAVVRDVGFNQRIADLHQLEIESGIALGIMAIISAFLGWLVAGRVLRPLRTITATAQEISEASLDRRLALPGPRDELRQLADTIDGLLARLEGAFDAQRRFVANASHELRTPLTTARALLEMVLSDPRATVATFTDTCQQVLKENEYQEELIDALLTLAQSQRGLDRRERVELGEMVRQVSDALALEAVATGVRVDVSVRPVVLNGDRRLIERLVSNLLENGIRYNDEDGRVEVSVHGEEGTAVLEVANTGPVVPPEEIERLLAPFQRLSRERTDHSGRLGLGLSIVAAIANAHGAQLEIRPREGGGLIVVVRFPLEPVLQDLAKGVTGQRVVELDPPRTLERGEALSGELEQPLR